MKYTNTYLVSGLALMAVLLSACHSEPGKTNADAAALSVKTDVVKSVNQESKYSYAAKIEPEVHAVLSTRIMGYIKDYKVKTGQKVKKGQVLLQINDQDIRAKKAQIQATKMEAEAAFQNTKKDVERFRILFDEKSASQKELDDMETQYKMAKARLEAVKQAGNEINEQLKYTTIKAPYNGIITKKYLNAGDLASPGMPLLGIEKSNSLVAIARIPENEISHLNIGDTVDVSVNAANGMELKGKIAELNTSALLSGGLYEVKIVLEDEKAKTDRLHSGMYAHVQFCKGDTKSIMIPEEAVIYRGQLCGVYTLSQSNTALLRWVRLGKKSGDKVEILSGLNEGESYIKSYKGKIWDGVKVSVVK